MPSSPYVSYATYDDEASGLSFQPKTALKQSGVSAKSDWKINDAVRSEVILSYRKFNGQFATDADQSPINEQTVDGRQAFQSRTAEARFSGRAFDKLDWTVGAFYLNARFHSDQTVSIPALLFAGSYNGAIAAGQSVAQAEATAANFIENIARFLVNGHNITDSENKSAFAHGVYDLTDKLSLDGRCALFEGRQERALRQHHRPHDAGHVRQPLRLEGRRRLQVHRHVARIRFGGDGLSPAVVQSASVPAHPVREGGWRGSEVL